MPGITCTGPLMYGTEGEPGSSSFRRRREAVGFMGGKERAEGLGETAATGWSEEDCKEETEDCAEGNERESFFIFLRGLLNF